MTNYFLMSLAIADLLVCTIVMPFGAVVFFKGRNKAIKRIDTDQNFQVPA